MENHNIKAKHNIDIEVNAPCPKCRAGHLLPFLKGVSQHQSEYANPYDIKFDHYEIYYKCSNCGHIVLG